VAIFTFADGENRPFALMAAQQAETRMDSVVSLMLEARLSPLTRLRKRLGIHLAFARGRRPTVAKKTATKRGSQKRDLVKPKRGGSRYTKRTKAGQFKEMDDVGRSLKADKRTKAKKTAKPGYGDQGDRKKRK
jgi:hypothetical protein